MPKKRQDRAASVERQRALRARSAPRAAGDSEPRQPEDKNLLKLNARVERLTYPVEAGGASFSLHFVNLSRVGLSPENATTGEGDDAVETSSVELGQTISVAGLEECDSIDSASAHFVQPVGVVVTPRGVELAEVSETILTGGVDMSQEGYARPLNLLALERGSDDITFGALTLFPIGGLTYDEATQLQLQDIVIRATEAWVTRDLYVAATQAARVLAARTLVPSAQA